MRSGESWREPATDAPTAVHGAAGGATVLPPGTLVGRYVVIDHIAAGGLGDVHSAYDPQLDRKIAIKLLRCDAESLRAFGDPTARLLREAQAMARVRHPNAVAVHDVGMHGGQVFVAMEFVAGPTLLAWARDRARDWRAVRDAFLQAGRGLAAAHEAGLVHRDFKLSNVIVGEDGRVVVLDFGLAKAFDRTPTPDGDPPTPPSPKTSLLEREMTRIGYLAGTPPYMAPELYAGGAGTPASDQFAFCVAFYHALFQVLPFEGATVEEHLLSIERGLPPAKSSRRVPPWLMRVLSRGVAVAPRDRYADMHVMLDALVEDRRRRRRGMIALALALPLAGAAVVAVPVALRPAPTQAETARAEQLAGEARAAAARGYYVHPPVDAPDGATAYRKIVELEDESGTLGPEARRTAVELRAEMSETLTRLGDEYWEREGGAPFAIDFYAAALVFDPDNAHADARASLSRGQLADLRGKAASGEFTATELAAAEPLSVLADADERSRTEKVKALYRRSSGTGASTRARLSTLLAPKERDVAAASEREGLAPIAQGTTPASPAVAAGATPTVIADGEAKAAATVDTKGPIVAAREVKAGEAALKRGELGEAESKFHRALEAQRNNPDALAGLAQIQYERGDYDKAVRFASRAADAAPRSARIRILLGDAHFKVLAYDAARRAYEKAQSLGSGAAEGRLARLDALTSTPKKK
jgi:tetratricopeptide (TPR) repeat protein